jgi:curved DNA-binding protein
MSRDPAITLSRARELLGVGPFATAGEVRRAFREAAKVAHPDRPGGGSERFREVVAAYQKLARAPIAERVVAAPPTRPEPPGVLAITPLVALQGGEIHPRLADGRTIRVRAPAGLRTGDTVRAAGASLTVAIISDPAMMVRGDDLWVSVGVDPRTLVEGGRVALETPVGRRIVWVTRKAGERGLVRVVGQGLPARGSHPQGHLFVRLAARRGDADSAARVLLRRFTAAWAA